VSAYDGSSGSIWKNGTVGSPASTTSTPTFAISIYGIGEQAAIRDNETWNGYIGEVLVFNTALTTFQRQQIETYLSKKWGVALSYSVPTTPLLFSPTRSPVPILSNTLITNQPSIFFPPRAQMISTSNSGLGSPTIAGCSLWLDAADTTTITSNAATGITQWADKSGSGYVATKIEGTINSITLNNLPAINLDNNRMTIPNFIWSNSFTAFAVARAVGGNYMTGFTNPTTGAWLNYFQTGNWALLLVSPSFVTTNPDYTAPNPDPPPDRNPAPLPGRQNWFIFAIGYNGGTTAQNFTFNGSPCNSNPGTATGPGSQTGTYYINGLSTGSYGYCTVAEIIHFNRSITSQERQTVEGYLATKWGLRPNLPFSHPYFSVPYNGPFALNPSTPVSKSIFIAYQTPALSSTMRFATGNDVSGGAFGFSQTRFFMAAPYQYGGYGDTRWTVNQGSYSLPTVLSAIYDAPAGIIRGDRSFNVGADVRESALINIISNTPYSLGVSPISSSIVTSASFHVCEIIAYDRALATTDRQMIEGYLAWKWEITGQLPIGHPYKEFPPSGEQVIIPSTPPNLMAGLVSWIDMADTSSYTLSGTTLATLRDKATVNGSFTVSGKLNGFSFSRIGSLPALVFPGNNTSALSDNTFLFRQVPVPSQGSACLILTPKSQFTATKLGILGWGSPGNGNSSGNIALGYDSPTVTVQTVRSYNTASTFFGPSLNLAADTPTMLFWAWYAGNMVYFSCNGRTLLTSTQGTYYNASSTDSRFYIGNDGGFGAQFTLGELVVYNQYGETPFQNLIEGHLAWKWGLQSNLPSYHPYYYSAPGLQSLTEVNALSQPSSISGLTMWLDAADTTTVQQVNSAVTFTGSPTLLGVSNGYTYYAFRGNGSITSATPLEIQYFAVGGGGGGAYDYGAGGGAGGLQTNTSVYAYSSQVSKITPLVPGATYSITIGTGGAYRIINVDPYRGDAGGNTTFVGPGISVTANGGGGGGRGFHGSGGAGGSGGGGGYPFDTSLNPGGIGNQGGNGITGVLGSGSYWGGAGGGIGGNATSGGPTPRNGGVGLQFFGTFYGGGGGGAGSSGNSFGSGGSGVGGTGAYGNGNQATGFLAGIPPVANSGGGGAGGSSGYAPGTAGAAGIFIVGIPSTQSVWIDKSAVANHVYSTTPGNAPTPSNFGTARRPSVYFGPGKSARSTYNSGASTGQFSAFMVASVPTLSYLLISTGQYTTGTSPAIGQTFAFFGSNGSLAGVCSPFTGGGGTRVGNYSTICGATIEMFASVSGLTTLGNLNYGSTVSGTCATIPATPWMFGDCLYDTSPKSFHVHEFITFSRQLATNERWVIEGYLYWKWMHLI